jgi:hypothetical protein
VSAVLSPEELRRAAMDTLGPYADERAREALLSAVIRVDEAVTSWESSEGHVQGHRVTLAVDATTLARLRSSPALVDALHAALATAVARAIPSGKGDALAALDIRWARDAALASTHGYRDRPPDPPQTLQQALASYLETSGEATLARFVEGAAVSTEESTVTVVVDPEQLRAFRSWGGTPTVALTAAVRDLVGDPATRVVVEC